MADKDLAAYRIEQRLKSVRGELKQERDFREYGATNDIDYMFNDARIAALKKEIEILEEEKENL